MKFKIYSDRPVNIATIQKIIDIFKESQCPNESMFNSIENFNGFDGRNIQLGTGNGFFAVVRVNEGSVNL